MTFHRVYSSIFPLITIFVLYLFELTVREFSKISLKKKRKILSLSMGVKLFQLLRTDSNIKIQQFNNTCIIEMKLHYVPTLKNLEKLDPRVEKNQM